MRRVIILIYFFAVLVCWITGSQTWASATIIETGQRVTISGIDAYPQLTFLLLTGLLIVWLSRYLNSLFSKFLTTAVVVLLLATSAPVWFESAAGSMSILSPQIAKATGVSDWLGQSDLLEKASFDHFSADVFVTGLILWLISTLWLIWSPRNAEGSKKLVTRIDKLPTW
jgi:hypothetical protein